MTDAVAARATRSVTTAWRSRKAERSSSRGVTASNAGATSGTLPSAAAITASPSRARAILVSGAMELSSDYIELEDLASQLVDTVKPLMRGGSLTIDFIDCGDYDVRIIDDTNTECVLPSLRLCFENADWYITNADLANCGFQ